MHGIGLSSAVPIAITDDMAAYMVSGFNVSTIVVWGGFVKRRRPMLAHSREGLLQ